MAGVVHVLEPTAEAPKPQTRVHCWQHDADDNDDDHDVSHGHDDREIC